LVDKAAIDCFARGRTKQCIIDSCTTSHKLPFCDFLFMTEFSLNNQTSTGSFRRYYIRCCNSDYYSVTFVDCFMKISRQHIHYMIDCIKNINLELSEGTHTVANSVCIRCCINGTDLSQNYIIF
jgi:hypothetical protein